MCIRDRSGGTTPQLDSGLTTPVTGAPAQGGGGPAGFSFLSKVRMLGRLEKQKDESIKSPESRKDPTPSSENDKDKEGGDATPSAEKQRVGPGTKTSLENFLKPPSLVFEENARDFKISPKNPNEPSSPTLNNLVLKETDEEILPPITLQVPGLTDNNDNHKDVETRNLVTPTVTLGNFEDSGNVKILNGMPILSTPLAQPGGLKNLFAKGNKVKIQFPEVAIKEITEETSAVRPMAFGNNSVNEGSGSRIHNNGDLRGSLQVGNGNNSNNTSGEGDMRRSLQSNLSSKGEDKKKPETPGEAFLRRSLVPVAREESKNDEKKAVTSSMEPDYEKVAADFLRMHQIIKSAEKERQKFDKNVLEIEQAKSKIIDEMSAINNKQLALNEKINTLLANLARSGR
eukprot:TRINITY_DN279_c0_g1_i3.p1 TRINITY_DN279_c0_g1~~TRINITY_DN279_c0_g1_i3.p1  ORF type:complete len:400 (+),score=88.54 TRINITY_DN279_c0_g1_i3:2-1201(+)